MKVARHDFPKLCTSSRTERSRKSLSERSLAPINLSKDTRKKISETDGRRFRQFQIARIDVSLGGKRFPKMVGRKSRDKSVSRTKREGKWNRIEYRGNDGGIISIKKKIVRTFREAKASHLLCRVEQRARGVSRNACSLKEINIKTFYLRNEHGSRDTSPYVAFLYST